MTVERVRTPEELRQDAERGRRTLTQIQRRMAVYTGESIEDVAAAAQTKRTARERLAARRKVETKGNA